MEISDQELRAMIREAIARQGSGAAPRLAEGDAASAAALHAHASHGLLPIAPGGDGACIIEPAVRCTHCGYCKSLGY